MASYTCAEPGCACTICLTDGQERRLRETHATFYCPLRHSNWFPGKSAQEKKVEELERSLRLTNKACDRAWEVVEEQRVATSSARRAARTCPLCGTRFRTARRLPDHLVDAHGAQVSAPLEIEAVR